MIKNNTKLLKSSFVPSGSKKKKFQMPKEQFVLRTKADEDEDEEDTSAKSVTFAIQEQSVKNIVIFLDEGIRDASYYRPILHMLDSLTQNDIVRLRIDSTGGSVDGAVALIDAIRLTDAYVVAEIKGKAYSAASMIALSCDEVIASPWSKMLIHSCSFGAQGMGDNVAAFAPFMNDWAQEIMHDIYEGFCTEEELENIFRGQELLLSSQDIDERVLAMQKYRVEEANKQESSQGELELSENRVESLDD